MSTERVWRLGQSNGPDRPGVDYRAFFEAVPGHYVVILPDDPRFTVVVANDAWLQAIGRSREEVEGGSLFELIPQGQDPAHAATLENLRASFRRVLATRQPDTMPVQRYNLPRSESAGGGLEESHWSLVNSPVLGADGAITHIIHHREDVTERDRTKGDRRESERRFRALVTATSDVVYRMSADWSEMFYLRGRDFIADTEDPSRTWLERYIHPDDQARVMVAIQEAIRTRTPFELEHRVIRVDGTLGWTFSRAIPLVDAHGTITEWFGAARDVTERKRAEWELRESETRFRNLADHAPVMVWVTEPDGSCTYLNRNWYEFTGQTEEMALGLGWLDATHPEDKAEAERAFLEANRRHEAFRLEYRLRRKDGAWRWAIDAAAPRFGNDGEFLGYVGSVIDITERKEMEEALRASEGKYRTLFESIDEGFCIIEMLFDADGKAHDYRFLEANPAFEKHSGLIGATGRTIRELVPAIEPSWAELYGQVALTGEPQRFDANVESMGRWFDIYAFRIGKPQERQVAVLFNDSSERILARRKLEFLDLLAQASRELVDPAEVMVVITQLLGQHLGVSRCAYADVEADTERFTILHDYTVEGVASTAGSYHLSLFGPRVAADQHEGRTLVIHDVDDELAPAEGAGMFNAIGIKAIICCPLVKQGRLTAMMAVHQNEPRRWAQHEVDLVQATVERAWAYIERSRAMRTLRDSNEQLARTNRDLEEFAHVASHDLQEPLRMVNTYSQFLIRRLGQEATGEQKEFVGFIQRGVSRMEKLIKDLLSYSRTVHTASEMAASEASLHEALRQALTAVGDRLTETGAEITHDALPAVRGDVTQLSHVFQNLLSNALKYRKHAESPRIHISAQRQENEWVVSIRDNGIGFDPRQAGRIFGLFKRLHTETEYPGTGLGLAICKRIIERYGGTMWAESEPGVGSTFFFSLPEVPL